MSLGDVVSNGTSSEWSWWRAAAIAAKVECDCAIASSGEVVEKVFVPTPGPVPCTVYENHWRRMQPATFALVDYFDHETLLPMTGQADARESPRELACEAGSEVDHLAVGSISEADDADRATKIADVVRDVIGGGESDSLVVTA